MAQRRQKQRQCRQCPANGLPMADSRESVSISDLMAAQPLSGTFGGALEALQTDQPSNGSEESDVQVVYTMTKRKQAHSWPQCQPSGCEGLQTQSTHNGQRYCYVQCRITVNLLSLALSASLLPNPGSRLDKSSCSARRSSGTEATDTTPCFRISRWMDLW